MTTRMHKTGCRLWPPLPRTVSNCQLAVELLWSRHLARLTIAPTLPLAGLVKIFERWETVCPRTAKAALYIMVFGSSGMFLRRSKTILSAERYVTDTRVVLRLSKNASASVWETQFLLRICGSSARLYFRFRLDNRPSSGWRRVVQLSAEQLSLGMNRGCSPAQNPILLIDPCSQHVRDKKARFASYRMSPTGPLRSGPRNCPIRTRTYKNVWFQTRRRTSILAVAAF